MKISIFDGEKRRVIRLPLAILKSRLVEHVLKSALKNSSQRSVTEMTAVENGDSVEQLNEVVCKTDGNEVDVSELSTNATVTQSLQCDEADDEQQDKKFVAPDRAFLKEVYAVLRKAVKLNGHFDLVDVQSSDGDTIKITI